MFEKADSDSNGYVTKEDFAYIVGFKDENQD